MEMIGERPKNKDFQGRSFKNFKQGLGRLLGRRSITITEYDPVYKVVYLGNVLTGFAKGDSCTEKPLSTLWKNYSTSSKPDVQMKLIVTQSGLKAMTKQHGLTEYWSHRITYCCAPTELPKIFCWVYRHEGRKLKQELRCHAVLCSKESVAKLIASQLQARLTQALIEFKRDKLSRQNARLSLANAVYDNPSLPRRKILLSTGSYNYRPPLERSKSAPKLMAIEESVEEEEDTDVRKFKRAENRKCGRYLTYSTRGNKLGTHCFTRSQSSSEVLNHTTVCVETEKSSHCAIVEENPFGSPECEKALKERQLLDMLDSNLKITEGQPDTSTEKYGCMLDKFNNNQESNSWQSDDFNKPEENSWQSDVYNKPEESSWESDAYNKPEEDNSWQSVELDNQAETNSWQPEESYFLNCEDTDGKYNSLVRKRCKLFENNNNFKCKSNVTCDGTRLNLVKHRRKLFEDLEKGIPAENEDADSALQFDLCSDNTAEDSEWSPLDEDSNSSLRSISSGSDVKIEHGRNYDLDSLWEEDSDESGFVEPPGQDGNDDKVRDVPHHHLMRNCMLTSKTRCVEV